jgi:hypothetical protein
VEVIAEKIHPASMSAPKPESVRRDERTNPLAQDYAPWANFTDLERQEIAAWKKIAAKQNEAIEVARRRIRRILGNGWDHAIAQQLNGKHIELPAAPWRTDEANSVLITGKVATDGNFVDPSVIPTELWQVFLPDSAVQKCLVPEWVPSQASTTLTGADAAPRRPSYSPDACRGWFVLRTRTWPEQAPYPSEEEDLEAAQNYFEGRIPRDEFREIRRRSTPDNWRKPGPRGPRQ